MAWKRGFRKNKGKRSIKKNILYKKPTAQNQKFQLARLATQVSSLRRRQFKKARWSQYSMQSNQSVGSYSVFDYSDPSSWSNVFEDPTNAGEQGSVQLKSLYIDNIVDIGSEGSGVIDFSYFLVTLRASSGKKLLDDCGQDLSGLVDGVHYKSLSESLVHLNKAYFDIKYAKRFSLSNQTAGTSAQVTQTTNLFDTMRRFTCRIMRNCKIKNASGNWIINGDDVPVYGKCYAIVFSNNSAVDMEFPSWRTNAIQNVKWA